MAGPFDVNSTHTLTLKVQSTTDAAQDLLVKAQVQPGGNVAQATALLPPGWLSDVAVAGLVMPSAPGSYAVAVEIYAKLQGAPDSAYTLVVQQSLAEPVVVGGAVPPPAAAAVGVSLVSAVWS